MDIEATAPPATARARAARRIYRHRLPVRVMHWINVVCLTVLLMSGLNIFNAHPALYWGQESTFADPWRFQANPEVWLGAPSLTATGTQSCGNWTFASASASGESAHAGSSSGRATGVTPCDRGKRLYCLEQ